MTLTTKIFQTSNSVKRIARTRYPSYLFGLLTKEDRSPAFIFHDVVEQEFITDLDFLAQNNYETLATECWIKNRLDNNSNKSVLLTFDDARKNFYEVTFPLLKKYRKKATLFVPTRWISPFDNEIVDDQQLPVHENTFMNWSELKECAESGLVDVQSHAHRHALVYTSGKLIGFATPELLHNHDIYDWPMRHEGGKDILGPPPLGTPIYASQPLLSVAHRVMEDDHLSKLCRDFVLDNGGEEFFSDKNALSKLNNLYKQKRSNKNNFRILQDNEFVDYVISEFDLSAELFNRHLGFRPRYFAYPWMLGSRLSLDIAESKNIDAVFGVGIDYRASSKAAGNIPKFGRTKGDWLRFLPGTGRNSLRKVLPRKIMNFMASHHLAH